MIIRYVRAGPASSEGRCYETGAFAKLDADGSKDLDREEFAALLGPLSDVCTRNQTDAAFDVFDADKSGRISLQEFQETLFEFGGSAPPIAKPSHGQDAVVSVDGAAVPEPSPKRHQQAIAEAAHFVETEVDGDTMTDAGGGVPRWFSASARAEGQFYASTRVEERPYASARAGGRFYALARAEG